MQRNLQDILIETLLIARSRVPVGDVSMAKQHFMTIKEWKKELRIHDVTSDVVNALEGVPQGLIHHPEFDAFVHTYYVVMAVIKLKRSDLIEAAFLHDYGKGTKTNIGNDRIYAFGHPKESLKFIEKHRNRIKYYDLTYRMTKEHMNLPVGHKKLKDDIDLDDFITADKIISKQLYLKDSTWIDRFKNKIKEKWVFFKQRHSSKKVYVMVAPSGLGKSRYLKNIDSKYIVSPDEIRKELTGDICDQSMNSEVWATTKVAMKMELRRSGKVYLDATNVNKWLRVEFMSAFNGVKKIAIIFNGDVDTSIKRIQMDIDNNINRPNVPEDVIKKQFKLFYKGYNSIKHEFNKIIEVDCG